MHISIRQGASRTVLFALLLQGALIACDATSPVNPKSDGLIVPDPSLTVSASGLSATPVSWSRIDISWAANPSASGFEVFRSDNGVAAGYFQIATTAASARSYSSTELTGSTQYCYRVRSFKVAGRNTNYSAFAGPVCATTLPPPVVAPSETDAVPEASTIHIRWKDNSSDETGFHVERAPFATGPWVQSVDAPANATSAYVYGQAELQVCFRVIAFNTIGPSNPSTPDCTTPPASPTNLGAYADRTGINLTWTDNSAVESGYRVSRFEPGVGWSDIATLPANTVSYRDAGITPDITYAYRVQALKDGGYSGNSNQVSAVVSTTVPNAPSFSQVAYYMDTEGYGWNYLVIWWGDASTNEDGFRVEYSPDGLSDWSLFATTGANETYYQLQLSVYEGPPPPGCYRVIAFNAVGASTPSSIDCAEPGVVPTDLVATATDEQSIDLAWTDNASFETGYAVIRATAIDGEYSVVAILPANTTSFHDTGLASGQEYWYLVASVYGGGSWSGYSNYASATTGSGTSGAQRSLTVVPGRAGPTRVLGKPVPQRIPTRSNFRRTR